MFIQTYKPNPFLSQFVEQYWILENNQHLHEEFICPLGKIQILFHYGNPFYTISSKEKKIYQHKISVCGQKLFSENVISEKGSGMIGIVLHPHASSSLLPCPASEITNYNIDLHEIFTDWKDIHNQFMDCENNRQRVAIIENFLMRKVCIKNQSHYNMIKASVKEIYNSNGTIHIRNLAKQFYVSERTFKRMFTETTGINPKKMADITRLHRAFGLLESHHSVTTVSYLSGFYDQSHFIHNFKKYTGFTPLGYRKRVLNQN